MKKLVLLGALALFATSIGAQLTVPEDPKRVEALIKAIPAQQIMAHFFCLRRPGLQRLVFGGKPGANACSYHYSSREPRSCGGGPAGKSDGRKKHTIHRATPVGNAGD
ncbi:MAG: hypothetical protein ACR2II_01940 [Chthoniobacterales bacterium]